MFVGGEDQDGRDIFPCECYVLRSVTQMPPSSAFGISQADKQLDIGCQRESYVPGRGETGISDTPQPCRGKRKLQLLVATILQREPMK